MLTIRQILQRLQHNKSADITRKDLVSLKNSVLQNDGRPLESIKSSGRVAFFVLGKGNGGYRVRIGSRMFTLLTQEKLLTARMYIGLITENTGSTIRMTSKFEQIDLSGRISQLYKEFPIKIIQLVLRSGMPLKKETLITVQRLLKRYGEEGMEDILLDLWQKRLPPEQILHELRRKHDDGNPEERSGNKGKHEKGNRKYLLKDKIRKVVTENTGRESGLLLYNHIIHDNRSHWVHIPLNITHLDHKIEGYLRLCIDVTSKRMKKAVLHTDENSDTECMCEIIPEKGEYRLKGSFPQNILDKIVSSSPKIVDIINIDGRDFTGLGFSDAESLQKGVDLDA